MKYCALFTNALVVVISIVAVAVGAADKGPVPYVAESCNDFLHTIFYIDACWLSCTFAICVLDAIKPYFCGRAAREADGLQTSASEHSAATYTGVDTVLPAVVHSHTILPADRQNRLDSSSILCDRERHGMLSEHSFRCRLLHSFRCRLLHSFRCRLLLNGHAFGSRLSQSCASPE